MTKNRQEKNKYYSIGVVARMYNIHPQTLRLYEREGLLKPQRTKKNTRLYSEEDLRRLETILNLTRELGVNLAGVEIILNLLEKIEEMKKQVNLLLQYLQEEFRKDVEDADERIRMALVKAPNVWIIPTERRDRTESTSPSSTHKEME